MNLRMLKLEGIRHVVKLEGKVSGMEVFLNQPLYGVALTVVVYYIALLLQGKWRWLNPLFITSAVLILLVISTNTYESYQIGGQWLTFLLGPATVALGVPLYKHLRTIRKQFKAIAVGVGIGSVCGLAGVWFILTIFESSREVLLSMLPKSVTAPVSVEIVRQLGGIPELGVVFTVLTGLLGSMIGPALLKLTGITHDTAIGTAIGTSAHGIGTARVIRDSEMQGSISSLAMSLALIITSILAIPLYYLL